MKLGSSGQDMCVDDAVSVVKLVFTELTNRSRLVIATVSLTILMMSIYSLLPGVSGDPVWGNVPFAVVIVAMAAAGIAMAMRLPITARARTQAFLLASGIAAYAMGELIWMHYQIGVGVEPPYPGIADFFYGPAMYAPLALAMWSALASMRRIRDTRKPFIIAGAVSLFAAMVLWSSVLIHFAEDRSLSPLFRAVSLAYPLADVFLLLFPAIALVVVLADIGGVSLARPWYSVATAMLLLAISDTIYGYVQVHDVYVVGTILDVGWVCAFGMIVVGISRMLDVYSAEA